MEDGPSKPDPTIVNLALQRLGIQPPNKNNNNDDGEPFTYMIGDTPDDIRAAVSADSNVIGLGFVPPGCSQPDSLVQALYEAGAARVMFDMGQLEEVALGNEFDIYKET